MDIIILLLLFIRLGYYTHTGTYTHGTHINQWFSNGFEREKNSQIDLRTLPRRRWSTTITIWHAVPKGNTNDVRVVIRSHYNIHTYMSGNPGICGTCGIYGWEHFTVTYTLDVPSFPRVHITHTTATTTIYIVIIIRINLYRRNITIPKIKRVERRLGIMYLLPCLHHTFGFGRFFFFFK